MEGHLSRILIKKRNPLNLTVCEIVSGRRQCQAHCDAWGVIAVSQVVRATHFKLLSYGQTLNTDQNFYQLDYLNEQSPRSA